jgi:hypothetical protein
LSEAAPATGRRAHAVHPITAERLFLLINLGAEGYSEGLINTRSEDQESGSPKRNPELLNS